jgi:hypothetical protein
MKALIRSRWALLVVLLVVVRATLVLALGDVFFYGEELEKGVAAKAMLEGLDVPHHQLAYHYYEGGGFVISHCTALAFLVVGQNLLAHKLVALGFQVGILLLGCLFTRRLFGRQAATWFGLLFIFGPESYQKLGLINLGIHFEACFFLFCVLGLGGKLLFENSQRRVDWFLLGLATGAGLYFSYQVAIAALWVAVLLIYFRRRELLGVRCLIALLGTLIGALPLIAMYSLVGDEILNIHGTAISGGGRDGSNSILFREFLASIFVHGELGERVTPFAWLAAFVLACVFLLRRPEPLHHPNEHSRKQAALFVMGYLVLFMVVYLGSGFVQGEAYHYFLLLRLVPLWIFGAVLVAAALGELSESVLSTSRHLSIALGTILVGLGVRASLSALRTGHLERAADNWTILTRHKGYSYGQYFEKVMPHFAGSREDKLELIEGFDESSPGLLRADAVRALYREELLAECEGDLYRAWGQAGEGLAAVAGGDAEREAQYKLGLGALIKVALGWNQQAAFDAVMAAPEGERESALAALGRFGGGAYPLPEILAREGARAGMGEDAVPYLRGLGRWSYSLHRRDPGGIEPILASYPAELADPLREGFEAERAWNLNN